MHAETNILGKYDFPFGHLYKTCHGSMQFSGMQWLHSAMLWLHEYAEPWAVVNLSFSPVASDALTIEFLNEDVLKAVWVYLWTTANLQVMLKKWVAQCVIH